MTAIAKTIYSQLGANRFATMTGAKNFIASGDALIFKISGAKGGINRIRIELNADDTYTMQFTKYRGLDIKIVKECVGVYCDQLQSIFTEETGLYTHL